MKTPKISALFILFLIFIGMSGCRDKVFEEQTLNIPVYMTYEELRSAVKVSSPQTLQKPGKIYFKDQLIFVNEELEGIHVINNVNPAKPEFLAFIEIPGNVDIAIRNNTLYADSYVDLLAFDISNPEDIDEVGRLKDVFPPVIPSFDNSYGIDTDALNDEKGVIIDWEIKTVMKEVTDEGRGHFPWPMLVEFSNQFAGSRNASGGATTFGIGGSMARFTLFSDYLYAIDENKLKIISVNHPESMRLENSIELTWGGLETIFQYNNKLFFGTQTGMIIYDLVNPVQPAYISEFNHIQSCDPVVVQADLAYVTLRSGNTCARGVNRLDIIDLKEITDPQLVKSYDMKNPHGLGIDDQFLFICDGANGLKVYNAEDPLRLELLASFPEIDAWDVIPVQGLLFMIGEDGFFQYDYSGPDNISLVSSILVDNP